MLRVPSRAFAWLVVSLLLVACSGTKGGDKARGKPAAADDGRLTLFLTTELRGQIEPCGCTSDPLGDIARWAELIAVARQGGGAVIYMDGGSTLFDEAKLAARKADQERMTADLLAGALGDPLGAAAIGLGPTDLADGAGGVRLPRMAANVAADAGIALAPPRVLSAGGVKIGVFGVVAPRALAGAGVAAGDPATAARTAIAALRADGAALVVGLLHMTRAEARALVRDVPGIDFALIGEKAPDPTVHEPVAQSADRVGTTWLVQPASRGQVVSRLDVTMRPGAGMSDALGAGRVPVLEAEAAKLAADLAGWKAAAAGDADPQFIAGKERELAELRARAAALRAQPVQAPASGSYFTLTQIEIDRALPCSPGLVAAKRALDIKVGERNVAAAAGVKPPEPAAGAAGYAGIAECEGCHDEQIEFWKQTRHAGAWETLERAGKQLDLDCIGCHVVGWDKPGGSNLAFNEPLRDVQCEACHGPASLHVDSMGKSKVGLARVPDAGLCAGNCHTPEHSDTFQLDAYLRDVLGPGHGAARRKALGDGPTGRALRSAAIEKAGRAVGKGCSK